MTIASTYANILCDLLEITEERSFEFMVSLDGIITRGEQRLLHDLSIDLVKSSFDVQLQAHSRTMSIPSGLLRVDAMFATIDGIQVPIPRRDKSYCMMFAPDLTEEAPPSLYADDNTQSFYFVPTPDVTYDVTAYGLIKPDGLAESNIVTWLSTYYADILLKACLIEAENQLTNPTQVQVWKTDYASRLVGAQREVARLRAA